MNFIRQLNPVTRTPAELELLLQLTDIALVAGIHHCENLAGIPREKRFRVRQTTRPGPALRRPPAANAVVERPGLPYPTDEELADSARAAIARAGLPGAPLVIVRVINGWLIAEGEVESQSQWNRLDDVLRGLNGITGISNRVLLWDAALAERAHQTIVAKFVADARSQAYQVEVTAYDRTIVLTGSARTELERDRAVAAARNVPGAEAVVNRIALLPVRTGAVLDSAVAC